jgi:3'(2'), 5'-bisphosphate nucleotidase
MSVAKLVDEQGLQFLVDLADEAGRAIMAIYSHRESLQAASKADSSPLTEADLASNDILHKGLSARWPQVPILSVEGANAFAAGEEPPLYWAIDPLDGTKEFIKGNDEFTVNIALMVNGAPQVGVVGAPALGLMYVGALGEMCDFSARARRRDGRGWTDIRVSGTEGRLTKSMGKASLPYAVLDRPLRVAMSRSHPSPELADWLQQFGSFEGRDIGSSLKFCLVAEGAVDVYPRLGLTCIWDTAAGHALVVAAGGTVRNLDGAELIYREPAMTLNPYFVAWGAG